MPPWQGKGFGKQLREGEPAREELLKGEGGVGREEKVSAGNLWLLSFRPPGLTLWLLFLPRLPTFWLLTCEHVR